jgi:hypothetical protein
MTPAIFKFIAPNFEPVNEPARSLLDLICGGRLDFVDQGLLEMLRPLAEDKNMKIVVI